MTDDSDNTRYTAVAERIATSANDEERQLLLAWAQRVVEIRRSTLPVHKKLSALATLTKDSKAVAPLLKMTARELKRIGWDDRSWKARIGGGAVLVTLATIGNAGAGIAALGGAIGVPLWIIFGAGGVFVGKLIDQLSKPKNPTTTYVTVEGKKELPKR